MLDGINVEWPVRISPMWTWEGFKTARKHLVNDQIIEEKTVDDHKCYYTKCYDCEEILCECDQIVCESCGAKICLDCDVAIDWEHYCMYCCCDGMSVAGGHLVREVVSVVLEYAAALEGNDEKLVGDAQDKLVLMASKINQEIEGR